MKIQDPWSLPLPKEHPRLHQLAMHVIELLRSVPSELTSAEGGNVWLHHIEYAGRAVRLADHLDAALLLAAKSCFAASYAVLRTALEHSCLDELLLLADRYRERLIVDDSTYQQLKTEYESGQASWAPSVVSFERQGKYVALVRTGHHIANPDGTVVEHISPYHPVIDRHDAMLGPPDLQEHVAEAFSEPQQLREWAQGNSSLYHRYLKWSAIVDNLEVNDRLGEREGVQLGVHYQFLSAFVHATSTGYRLIDQTAGLETQDSHLHVLGELTLLYACSIAITEIRSLLEFVSRRDHIRFRNDHELKNATDIISSETSYFWFPRIGGPIGYDFVEEANRRADDEGRGTTPFTDAIPPDQISPDEVRYYRNPLKRLTSLHFGAREITTGLGYGPLW